MKLVLSLLLAVCEVASAQLSPVPPPATGMPDHPFFITKTWNIGGIGDWDYLTIDPTANQLFIAHGSQVQVVDVEAGTVAGVISHIREAHSVVLDRQGAYGYVSDGPADVVRVFDRRTFQVVASIPTGPSPRSMALDPTTGLLFVVGALQVSGNQPPPIARRNPPPRGANAQPPGASPTGHGPESTVTVIDVEQKVQLAQLVLPGALGFAQGDGNGQVYITVTDRNQIIRLDAQGVSSAVRRLINEQAAAEKKQAAAQPPQQAPQLQQPPQRRTQDNPLQLDLTGQIPAQAAEAYPHAFSLDSACERPRALAIDTDHERLFAACSNYRMVALDAESGHVVAQLPIGPGADAIGYDPNRGLIFTANGAADGSLTVIRQDVTDTYSVVQTLPTRQNARTLAINSSTGEVYLAAVIYGAELNNVNGASINMKAVDGSFQVLVVGN